MVGYMGLVWVERQDEHEEERCEEVKRRDEQGEKRREKVVMVDGREKREGQGKLSLQEVAVSVAGEEVWEYS